jgi:hypothetical protein
LDAFEVGFTVLADDFVFLELFFGFKLWCMIDSSCNGSSLIASDIISSNSGVSSTSSICSIVSYDFGFGS